MNIKNSEKTRNNSGTKSLCIAYVECCFNINNILFSLISNLNVKFCWVYYDEVIVQVETIDLELVTAVILNVVCFGIALNLLVFTFYGLQTRKKS